MTLQVFSDALIRYGYTETIDSMTCTYKKGDTTISYGGDHGIITMTIGKWIRYAERYSGFGQLYKKCEEILLIVKKINRKERINKVLQQQILSD